MGTVSLHTYHIRNSKYLVHKTVINQNASLHTKETKHTGMEAYVPAFPLGAESCCGCRGVHSESAEEITFLSSSSLSDDPQAYRGQLLISRCMKRHSINIVLTCKFEDQVQALTNISQSRH